MPLIYVFGFVPEGNEKPGLPGIEPQTEVAYVTSDGISAACCEVPESDYDQEALQTNVENMHWLKDRAYHHHHIMHELQQHASMVIPLSFGTVYEKKEGLLSLLNERAADMKRLFSELQGKQEWSMKLYADRSVFDPQFQQTEADIQAKYEEIEQLPRGKQFFEKKKLSNWLKERADQELKKKGEQLHSLLEPHTSDSIRKKVWEKKLSGRTEDMVWNGVYLFKDEEAAKAAADILRGEQEKLTKEETGIKIEAAGPWPPYHFAVLEEKETTS
ncbi:GvpL/GvpF family gas vesicle protein [Alkalicoccus luteus]|uniref:GvpL/GvpF family gas vesicle protein n=1 Tax=Alkalicoccus luteus TaxID=1237094 RepID=A0A969TV88_9BACI|nr:GvpL/GvpF family gas vesicle protein [Alkalicoccus luteus]NJP37852.1 GvpL/GvpF family gas vesicle protein [Alkalicoccus luteus]